MCWYTINITFLFKMTIWSNWNIQKRSTLINDYLILLFIIVFVLLKWVCKLALFHYLFFSPRDCWSAFRKCLIVKNCCTSNKNHASSWTLLLLNIWETISKHWQKEHYILHRATLASSGKITPWQATYTDCTLS